MSRSERIVYLSFDDGPVPDVTEFVLNTLKLHQVKGTFFCIGDNIIKHPGIFQSILNEGHKVGNHTFNHLKGWDTNNEDYLSNFQKCQVLTRSNLFRPPYGRIKKAQINLLRTQYAADSSKLQAPGSEPQTLASELQITMWDVLSGDFDNKISPEKCLKNVVDHSTNGSIIVFHDSVKAFGRLKYALPRAIEFLQQQNFQFGLL